jgi:xanthine dehydrogenase molybdopterin-binding subunit B
MNLPPELPSDRATEAPSGAAGAAIPHDSAAGHVSGAGPLHVDDQREPAGTVHVAPGMMRRRPGAFLSRGPGRARHPGRGRDMLVHSSTQHPTEVQHLVARCWAFPTRVDREVPPHGRRLRRQGEPGRPVACLAALAARVTGRPAKMRLDRDDDMIMTGKRHDFRIDYDVGFDDDGRLGAVDVDLASRCGCRPTCRSASTTAPCSTPTTPIITRASTSVRAAVRPIPCPTPRSAASAAPRA